MIPVAPGGPLGGLVTGPGQVQYGDMLLGGGTSAGWRELVGWRDLPDAQFSDTERPQSHGTYAGEVYADSATVTFTYLVRGERGDPEAKLRHLKTIERNTRMDGVERPLVVHDGIDVSMRWARVIGREVPMDRAFAIGPVECSVQWLCADPLRYSLTEQVVTVELSESSGGLVYPLAYPLAYGTASGGSSSATNSGGADAPLTATFHGPLLNPVLSCSAGWRMAWRLTLADGEWLRIDTSAGTALLNGTADRLYTIDPLSSQLDRCTLPPGATSLNLTAATGNGHAVVSFRHTDL